MKILYISIMLISLSAYSLCAQDLSASANQKQDIEKLIGKYTEAREKKDAALLESILTDDIDQLVSSGTWRKGKEASMQGMMRSSSKNPGTRTITVESFRLLTQESGIADAKYEIQNADGSSRKMWSTFIVVLKSDGWKISAIRNMLPAGTR